MNTQWFRNQAPARSREVSFEGFWRSRPYLALSESFLYEESMVILNQHLIINEQGSTDTHRFYTRSFSRGNLGAMMQARRFSSVRFREGLLPPSDRYAPQHVRFCAALKSPSGSQGSAGSLTAYS